MAVELVSSYDVVVMTLAWLLTLTSLGVNCVAAAKGATYRRSLFAAIATLSALYAAGYTYRLLSGDYTALTDVFRGVNLVTWGVVWIFPAIIHIRGWRRIKTTVIQNMVDTAEIAIVEAEKVRKG